MMQRLLIVAMSFIFPMMVSADENVFAVEAIMPTKDNFMFGKYNGLNNGQLLINTSFYWQSAKGKTPSGSWQLSGKNLSLDTRELNFTFQKDILLEVEYAEITHQGNDSGVTPFSGGSFFTLPQSWVAASSTTGFDRSLLANEFHQNSKRKILSLSLFTTLRLNKLAGTLCMED